MGVRTVSPNGDRAGADEAVAYDYRDVIANLAQQVGGLTAELAVRDAVITALRGELAEAREAGKGMVPAGRSKEA